MGALGRLRKKIDYRVRDQAIAAQGRKIDEKGHRFHGQPRAVVYLHSHRRRYGEVEIIQPTPKQPKAIVRPERTVRPAAAPIRRTSGFGMRSSLMAALAATALLGPGLEPPPAKLGVRKTDGTEI